MKKENCTRKPKANNNTIVVSFRITPNLSQWLHKENLSPRAILLEGCNELGYKGE